ncbi:MAG: hypothetical protein FJZ11_05115 [Candidatus Omnitrophica bacterium]|nr:hypothetical protein [Candidatus Omnitrophota bacterium]
MDWNAIITEPVKEMLTKAAGFVPNFIGALAILIIGWILAMVIKTLANKILEVIRFDVLAHKAGISKILAKGGVKLTSSQILAALVYWLVMIMVLVMVVNALGLTVASQLLESLVVFIPRVIAALFVLVIGMFLGTFVSSIVRTAAMNANLPQPEFLSTLSQYAIVVFALVVSLVQLGIATILVSTTFNILFGAICLGLALAFGLGGKDAAARYIEELKRRYTRK